MEPTTLPLETTTETPPEPTTLPDGTTTTLKETTIPESSATTTTVPDATTPSPTEPTTLPVDTTRQPAETTVTVVDLDTTTDQEIDPTTPGIVEESTTEFVSVSSGEPNSETTPTISSGEASGTSTSEDDVLTTVVFDPTLGDTTIPEIAKETTLPLSPTTVPDETTETVPATTVAKTTASPTEPTTLPGETTTIIPPEPTTVPKETTTETPPEPTTLPGETTTETPPEPTTVPKETTTETPPEPTTLPDETTTLEDTTIPKETTIAETTPSPTEPTTFPGDTTTTLEPTTIPATTTSGIPETTLALLKKTISATVSINEVWDDAYLDFSNPITIEFISQIEAYLLNALKIINQSTEDSAFDSIDAVSISSMSLSSSSRRRRSTDDVIEIEIEITVSLSGTDDASDSLLEQALTAIIETAADSSSILEQILSIGEISDITTVTPKIITASPTEPATTTVVDLDTTTHPKTGATTTPEVIDKSTTEFISVSTGTPDEEISTTVSSGEASGTTTEEDVLTTVVFDTTTTETPAEPTTPEEIDSAATTASVSPTIYNIFEVNGVMTSGKLAYSADLADNSTVAYISAGLTFCRNLKAALKHKLRNIGCEVTGFAQDAANSRRRRRSTTYKTDVSYTNSVVSSAATNTAFGTEYAAALADPVTAAQFVAQGFTSKSVATPVKSFQTVQAGACVTFNGQSLCGGAGSNMFGALILLAFGRYFL